MPFRRVVCAALAVLSLAGVARAASPSPLLALERIAAGADGMVLAKRVDHGALIAAINRRLAALPRTVCVDLRPALPELRFDAAGIVMSPEQWRTLAQAGALLGMAPADAPPDSLLNALLDHGLVSSLQVTADGLPVDLYYWRQAPFPGFWRNAFGDTQQPMTTPATITVHASGWFGGKDSGRDDLFYPVYCAGRIVAGKVLALGAPGGLAPNAPIDVYFGAAVAGVPPWLDRFARGVDVPTTVRGKALVASSATGYNVIAGRLFLDAADVFRKYPGIAAIVSVDHATFTAELDQMIGMAAKVAAAPGDTSNAIPAPPTGGPGRG